MSDIWVTSDSHFWHRNIIEYCNRPFADVEEMNEAMLEKWNEVVKEGDVVYHLGDFSFNKDKDAVERLVLSLKGEKHLVYGNHDQKSPVRQVKGWAWRGDYKRIHVGDQAIVLMHYPLLSWHGSHRGVYMLHGHCHGSLRRDPNQRRLDVGVDCWDFYPINYETIRSELNNVVHKPVDHHGADKSSYELRGGK